MISRSPIGLVAALFIAALLMAGNAAAQTTLTGAWTPRTLAMTADGAASARSWVDLIFDPVAGRPVLFGGSRSTYMNDILEMDLVGNRWLEIEPYQGSVTPLGPPCPRDEHAVEFDAYNRLYWTFGGSGYACNYRQSVVASGSTSTTIVDPTLTETTVDYYKDWFVAIQAMNTHYSYVSAYDPATKTLTLQTPFPGNPGGLVYSARPQGGGGTWYYNPATGEWKGFDAPSAGYVGAKPASRLSPAFAYSTLDEAIVMFGGVTHNDTWAIDTHSKTWVQLRADGAANQPARRAQMTNSMVYDSANDAFVLFGGRCGDDSGCGAVPMNGTLGDTWIYRLPTNTWTLMTPPVSPPPTQQHALSYDPIHGVVVLFGGNANGALTNSVWIYHVPSNTWSQPAISGSLPPVRIVHAMVYDPTIGEHIIYGGTDANLVTKGDVWSLRLSNPSGNLPPQASLTITPGTGTPATVFQFNGSASHDPDGSIVSHVWNFGDGATATGATTSHQYAAAGNYMVTLTVTDNQGASGANSSTIVVTTAGQTSTTTALTSSQNPSVSGSSVIFTATVSGASPTGTVAFTDNGTAIAGCASIALAGTTAQCGTSALATGSHAIVAAYAGDAANAPSTSPTLTQVVSTATTGVNVALASNGAIASASSTYAASGNYVATGTNNGDRKGTNWSNGGGWNDATASVFPDWVQVTFPTAQTIGEIDVFTVQDSYSSPIEPTLTTTFSQYGITAFEVQYWTGGEWAAVPGGIVTGNNKVWRQFTFAPITTDRIRVLVTGALASYARITEIEAWSTTGGTGPTPTTTALTSSQNPSVSGSTVIFTATVSGASPTGTVAFTDNGTAIAGCASIALASTTAQCGTSALATGSHAIVAAYAGDAANAPSTSPTLTQVVSTATTGVNVALASNGAIASASSTYAASGNYVATGTNNGDRKGTNWSNGGGWNDATASVFPDWVQVTFPTAQTIGEIDVFTVQDSYSSPIEPTLTTTFSQYGITAFEVQYWTGGEWAAVPGGIVTGNNKVWRQFTFAPITTDRIRVLVTGALASYARITEIEAWSTTGGTGPTPTTTALTSSQNPSVSGSSVIFTATVSGASPTGTVAFTDNGTAIAGCASVALASTTAQCGTSALATGSHAIVAAYAGDAGNAPSTSPTLTQVVSATTTGINVALASNGAIASASSTYAASGNYVATGTNNGDRKGTNWSNGGGWNDATASVFPDWVQVTFPTAQTIGEIDVFTVQDSYSSPIEPTLTTTFSQYGITAFEVQYWTGGEWAAVPGGIVTGNNKVWRQFTFAPITTDRIRVLVTGALASYARITEIEAWSQ